MKLLLDTHTFIWWDSEPAKLSAKALAACIDEENTVLLSVVSAWEMQIKSQLRKLELRLPLTEIISAQQEANRIEILPIRLEHVMELGYLPVHHSDPFDRLLIAQAVREMATLVSHDSAFREYDVELLW